MRRRRLSAAEEIALAKRIERGDRQAKETMVERNLGLVFWVARTYRDADVPFADLVQEGTVGLLHAVERFDHRRGVKFSTYAVWWIRRSIRDAISGSSVIRMPAEARRHLAAVRHAEGELDRSAPRSHSDAEIAERTGLSATTVRSVRGAAHVTASLDAPIGAGATPAVAALADHRVADPAEAVIAHEHRGEVAALLRLLPGRHREVLIRRYGLNGHGIETHDEIAAWLGVGEDRSRQLEREALNRLRSVVGTRSSRAA
jgi:RNA polymerase sigma factor (sigma-70 family)